MSYTIQDLQSRRSVRKYSLRDIESSAFAILKGEIETINPVADGVRFVLVENEPKVCAESKKTYGWFAGVKNYIVALYDTTPIDLGIAKFNFQAVGPGRWAWGIDTPFFTA